MNKYEVMKLFGTVYVKQIDYAYYDRKDFVKYGGIIVIASSLERLANTFGVDVEDLVVIE